MSSLGNFVMGVLVARSLDPAEFGAFGLAFVTFGVVLSAARGPATDPLLVRFSVADPVAWKTAVAGSTATSLLAGVIAAAGCALVGLALPGHAGAAYLALACGLPGILLQDSYRFAFFAQGRADKAFLNDLVWGVLQISGLLLLVAGDRVSVTSALLVFGGTASVAALLGMAQCRVVPEPARATRWLVDHRALGGRYLVENLSMGAARQVRIAAVGALAGLAAVGEIRAAEILMGPFLVLLSGVSQVSVPEAARVLSRDPSRLRRFLLLLAGGQAVLAAAWSITVLVALPLGLGEWLLGANWAGASPLLVPLAIVLVLACFENGGMAGLRALGAARRSLAVQAASAVLYVVAGTVGAVVAGSLGSTWGVMASTAVATVLWWQQLHAGLRDRWSRPVPSP